MTSDNDLAGYRLSTTVTRRVVPRTRHNIANNIAYNIVYNTSMAYDTAYAYIVLNTIAYKMK